MLVGAAAPAPARADAPPAPEVVRIWPGAAPGTEGWNVVEQTRPPATAGDAPANFVTNVTVPTLTVFRPDPAKATGAAVIVSPGGAFQGLAFNHEGVMVAQWLAQRGVTAFVLKYRVKPTPGFTLPKDIRTNPEAFNDGARMLMPSWRIAIADGVQAVRYIRANAARYGVDPGKVGFMGFSAGAMTTMGVVTDSAPADRPNFAATIYGAKEPGTSPPKGGPPLFIAAAQDDPVVPVGKSVEIFSNWTAASLPAELHIYQTGGHGFGMLPRHKASDAWPVAFEAWLRAHGWIAAATPARP
jgi:acetyl esterase/lipase